MKSLKNWLFKVTMNLSLWGAIIGGGIVGIIALPFIFIYAMIGETILDIRCLFKRKERCHARSSASNTEYTSPDSGACNDSTKQQ